MDSLLLRVLFYLLHSCRKYNVRKGQLSLPNFLGQVYFSFVRIALVSLPTLLGQVHFSFVRISQFFPNFSGSVHFRCQITEYILFDGRSIFLKLIYIQRAFITSMLRVALPFYLCWLFAIFYICQDRSFFLKNLWGYVYFPFVRIGPPFSLPNLSRQVYFPFCQDMYVFLAEFVKISLFSFYQNRSMFLLSGYVRFPY